tara:strand:- start:117 stop:443 length:327 start_codon:yes stop_codon:yes gene_type:complete
MQSYGLVISLKNDQSVIAKYKKFHYSVWPQVKKDLISSGVKNMKIFIFESTLFMYMEASDNFDFSLLANASDETREWNKIMNNLQVPVSTVRPGEWWHQLEKVYDLEW